jgi:hypothetical protein
MTLATRAISAAGASGKTATKAAAEKEIARDIERYHARENARAERKNAIAPVRSITPVDLSENRKPEMNSALLLDNMNKAFRYWARWESPELADIATLWAASTWFTDQDGTLLFPAHPRLFMIGEKGSGKTRIMKIVKGMVKDATGIVKAPVTAPGLRDALAANKTIILDEFDRQVISGRSNMDIQSIVSAYERDTASLNSRSGGANEQSLFGPMMLSAKEKILTTTGGWIDDLFERSFIITPVKWTDQEDPIPDLDEDFDVVMEKIQLAMGMWGEAVRPAKGLLRPIHTVPKALTGREREISSALLTVADRAVDPKLIDSEGEDLRWALRGRAAVQKVLLGHGENGSEIIADLTEKFEMMGAS